jgi:Ice-binding-like/Bacterial Ig-like domain
MIKQEPLRLWFIAMILIAFMSTWAIVSSSQIEAPSSSVPMVTATSPTDGATAVTLNQPISVTLSQAMSAPSMAACLLLQQPDGTPINGTVSTFGRTSIFRPLANLAPNITYTGRVRREASDLAGVTLGHSYVWTFTTGSTSDSTAPTVTFTSPANLDVNVPTNQKIVAMFSKEMSAGTLNTATFTVTKPGGIAVTGAVNYASGSVTFRPIFGLRSNTHYIATITTGARDLARNPLAANYVWSFDTGLDPSSIRPTVTSTNPANNASLVPLDQQVSATFSKAMNYASITTGDFLLTWSGGQTVGTVTYAYDSINKVTTATFVPKANLLSNTLYTATITSEAEDLLGNAIVGNRPSTNYVWQFTTGASLSPVPLGAAANFAVLAAAAITNTSTATTITGDVGIWPGTSMTNFPPGIVIGTIHVNDVTAQAAEAALAVAYNNAKGRVGAFTPAVGNIGGLTFTPGLYRSGTSTAISGGGNLTLDAGGDPNAVFIFQIASTLTTSSGFGVTLTGGAKPSQIFWQVGSSATIGTGSAFYGTILANTSITIVSGATLNGRALAGAVSGTGAVTLDNNTIVKANP